MSAASPQKQIFVAWDMSKEAEPLGHRTFLHALHNDEVGTGVNRRRVFVPGLDESTVDIPTAVLAKIDTPDVDIVAALLDRANSNVAFEVGFALGRGKKVLLLHGRPERPTWSRLAPLSQQPLFRIEGAKNFADRLAAAADDGRTLASVTRPRGRPLNQTLLLCSERPRREWAFFNAVSKLRPAWSAIQGNRGDKDAPEWALAELPDRVGKFGRVVWIYQRESDDPVVPSEHPPDGEENAALALMAGYAFGLGGARSQTFLREGRKEPKGRVLADVESRTQTFVDIPALKKRIGDLSAETTVPQRVKDAFDQTLDDYRAAALRDYGSVRLLGFPQSMHAALSLDALHVEVFCRRRGFHRGKIDRASSRARFERETGIDLARFFAAGPALGRKVPPRNAVLVGHPGLGKSTQLKRMLCHVLREQDAKRAEDLPTNFGLPPNVVPLFVPLHRLRRAKDRLKDLVSAELTRLGVVHAGTFVQQLFAKHPVLLLLDGLDEATAEGVAALAPAWAAKALAEPKDARGVVTVRYEAFPKTHEGRHPLVAKARAEIVELRTLDELQVCEFVGKWYEAVETTDVRRDASADSRQLAKRRAADLRQLLRDKSTNSTFAGLAKTPLLLTALCLIHREGGGSLPRSRAAVLKACIDVLLVTWRRSQGVVAAYDAEDAAAILRAVGRFMQDKGVSSATAADLQETLARELSRRVWHERSAAAVLDEIRLHSGVLVGDANSGYEFPHRGFREFFAAESYWRHIGKEPRQDDQPGLLARLVREAPQKKSQESWNETIHLFLALRDPCYAAEWFAFALRSPLLLKPEFEKFVDSCWRVADDPPIDAFLTFLRASVGDAEHVKRHAAAKRILDGNSPKVHSARHATFTARGRSSRLRAQPATVRVPTPESAPSGRPVSKPILSPKGGVELVRVKAGDFHMGSPANEVERDADEGPRHKVRITRPFLLGRFPVTNGEFGRFLAANRNCRKPLNWGDRGFDDPRQPVIGVDWGDAVEFCRWAGGNGVGGLVGTLPTEAQWEFAARADRQTRYWSGNDDKDLDHVGWHVGNSDGRLHRVGEKLANPWGLHDVHGLVWEWCSDWYGDYPKGAVKDPFGPMGGDLRVFRGGSWMDDASGCRSAARFWNHPKFRWHVVGFRLALSAPPNSAGPTVVSSQATYAAYQGAQFQAVPAADPAAGRFPNGGILRQ